MASRWSYDREMAWVMSLDDWEIKRIEIEEQFWLCKFKSLEVVDYASLVAKELLAGFQSHQLLWRSRHLMFVVGYDLDLCFVPHSVPMGYREVVRAPCPREVIYEAVADRFGLVPYHSDSQSHIVMVESERSTFHPPRIILSAGIKPAKSPAGRLSIESVITQDGFVKKNTKTVLNIKLAPL